MPRPGASLVLAVSNPIRELHGKRCALSNNQDTITMPRPKTRTIPSALRAPAAPDDLDPAFLSVPTEIYALITGHDLYFRMEVNITFDAMFAPPGYQIFNLDDPARSVDVELASMLDPVSNPPSISSERALERACFPDVSHVTSFGAARRATRKLSQHSI